MKTPLRYQVTESDCGSVSLINAISYLFEREEIPAELIKAINMYTLDCYDEKGVLGAGGTSRKSIKFLTQFLNSYSDLEDFGMICERLTKEKVILGKIKQCLANRGVIFIRCCLEVEHYVIITNIDQNNVYIFDPYYLDENEYHHGEEVKIIANHPFTHNRTVSLKRLFEESKHDFALGPVERRECVLINKKSR